MNPPARSANVSEEDASLCLNAVNEAAAQGFAPWHLGLSFGRALQHSCLQHWGGRDREAGQAALLARARANGAASRGAYVAGGEPSDDASLFVANYSYGAPVALRVPAAPFRHHPHPGEATP